MSGATFARPDLTMSTDLDTLGLEVVGQRLGPAARVDHRRYRRSVRGAPVVQWSPVGACGRRRGLPPRQLTHLIRRQPVRTPSLLGCHSASWTPLTSMDPASRCPRRTRPSSRLCSAVRRLRVRRVSETPSRPGSHGQRAPFEVEAPRPLLLSPRPDEADARQGREDRCGRRPQGLGCSEPSAPVGPFCRGARAGPTPRGGSRSWPRRRSHPCAGWGSRSWSG